jgi:hypothetical protein
MHIVVQRVFVYRECFINMLQVATRGLTITGHPKFTRLNMLCLLINLIPRKHWFLIISGFHCYSGHLLV